MTTKKLLFKTLEIHVLFLFKRVFFLISVVLKEYIGTEKVKNVFGPSDIAWVSPLVLDLDFLLYGSQRKDHVHPGEKKDNESHPVSNIVQRREKSALGRLK